MTQSAVTLLRGRMRGQVRRSAATVAVRRESKRTSSIGNQKREGKRSEQCGRTAAANSALETKRRAGKGHTGRGAMTAALSSRTERQQCRATDWPPPRCSPLPGDRLLSRRRRDHSREQWATGRGKERGKH